MNEHVSLRNMTSIYISYKGKMLLLYRQGSRVVNDVWVGSAGGHFEECELNHPQKCVLRECMEELSITEDMLENLRLRYITLRHVKGEIRQNYYYFADLKDGMNMDFRSNEGILKWFAYEDLSKLTMPYSAQYVMKHYLETGQYNEKLYCGVADGEKVVFKELQEF